MYSSCAQIFVCYLDGEKATLISTSADFSILGLQ
jgi:hypothetical protein